MTEDEAKTKWCPFARVEGPYAYGNPAINRTAKNQPAKNTRCIGSACMAWRKLSDEPGEIVERRDMGVEPPPEGWMRSNKDHPDTLNKTFGDWIRSGPWKPAGFCGLAGDQS